MSCLLTADIHMNNHPRDEYRWGLFEWLAKQEADELIICGDLTDAKDNHPSKLVNRLHKEIKTVAKNFDQVVLLKGNHDYYDAEHPFFEFLDDDNIVFVSRNMMADLTIGKAFFVPAGSSWDGLLIPDVDFIFAHATFNGAEAENGTLLPGVSPSVLNGYDGYCYSGDIHVPQRLNKTIEYIGAPYHVHFGDRFEPRCLLVQDDWKTKDLHFPAPRKHAVTIRRPDELLDERAKPGDHVKVKCQLRRAEYVEWNNYKARIHEIAAQREWLLFEASPAALIENDSRAADEPEAGALPVSKTDTEIIEDYASRKKADDEFVRVGRELLNPS